MKYRSNPERLQSGSRWLCLGAIAVALASPRLLEAEEAGESTWVPLAHAPEVAGIEANPLKGMFPYAGAAARGFPHSMEWFYLPLSELQKSPDDFEWEPLEKQLTEIAGRGHHAVFRIYLDYPGKPVGTPRFLIDAGVAMRDYSEMGNEEGASKSPDWNDERLLTALESFISHLGRKYDGDPRIGFITAGLYGFWGEWHNYPHDPAWAMSEANRDRLLTAYTAAFTRTHVLLRDPKGTKNAKLKLAVGYHDDSFAYETLRPEWAFLPSLKANGLTDVWKTKPIGGEVRPELQSILFDKWPDPTANTGDPKQENLPRCIAATHASWMLNHGIFDRTLTSMQRSNALRAQRALGYEFQVVASRLERTKEGKLRVDVRLRNTGVAPFYYDWPAEFASYDPASGTLKIQGSTTDWNLPAIQPDEKEHIRSAILQTEIPEGHRLLLRFVNPLPNGSPLRFASDQQDDDQEGWLTLQTLAGGG